MSESKSGTYVCNLCPDNEQFRTPAGDPVAVAIMQAHLLAAHRWQPRSISRWTELTDAAESRPGL